MTMSPRGRWLTASILAAALTAAGCLTASQESRLKTDMADVREQVFAMQRDTAAVLARLEEIERSMASQGSRTRFADLEAVLRTLTDEVRALGARLDDNTSRMTALSRDVIAAREQYRSLEARLAAALATRGLQQPFGQPPPPAGQRPLLATDPNAHVVAAPGGDPNGTLPDEQGTAAPLLDEIAPPADDAAPPATPPSGPEAADEAAQEEAYRNAYGDFTRGAFGNAVTGFQEFLRRYPASPLAGRAQYLIGECYFSEQRYEEAARAFTLTIENHPGSDKVAAAYLKKGLALLALKQTARGVIQLQHVIETYPRTEEARVAADQLRQLGLRDQ